MLYHLGFWVFFNGLCVCVVVSGSLARCLPQALCTVAADISLVSGLLWRKQKVTRISYLNMEITNWLGLPFSERTLRPVCLPKLGLQHMLACMLLCEHWALKLGSSCLCCKYFTQWAIPSNQACIKNGFLVYMPTFSFHENELII